jgi:hypothetical protein
MFVAKHLDDKDEFTGVAASKVVTLTKEAAVAEQQL